MKRYYTQNNIGKCKYAVNFHDGKKQHADGSDFFDIKIFKNKKKLQSFIDKLESSGFIETIQGK